jgi:hypothetical protein
VSYFPDSSPYGPYDGESGGICVGWLDAEHAFETEPPSEELLDALWAFVTSPVEQTRGLHECELCPRDADYYDKLEALRKRMRDPSDPFHRTKISELPWPEDARTRSNHAERHGQVKLIGSAEIRAFGDVIYAAPTLIYHYVLVHHYKPPSDFVRALLTGPRPDSDAYRALLAKHSIPL